MFGPWQTIWTWHRRLAREGTWDVVLQRLRAFADATGLIDWSISIDSTIARAHQHATTITRHTRGWIELHEPGIEPPDHAIGRSRGGWTTKIHRVVDGNGRGLVTLLTAGQAGDSPMFEPLMAHL